MSPTAAKYVVISPVKDEAEYIEATLKSVINQSVRPGMWVIVDDGSRDATPSIVARYAATHSWIKPLTLRGDGRRQPGPPVIHAFNAGYDLVRNCDFDFVVKLDADLDLPSDYFEKLMAQFEADAKLGIASGTYCERSGDAWVTVPMPPYHAAGACKFMRAACFSQIGGFAASRGWDTVDEIRALCHGWKTAHFPQLVFKHLKTEGSGIGAPRTNVMHGEVYYLTGGGALFFTFKVLHRMVTGTPRILGGLLMAYGFLRLWLKGTPRLVTSDEARFYRRLLNRRITGAISGIFRTA